MTKKLYKLIDKNDKQYLPKLPCTLGGQRKLIIYGRLDCSLAFRYLANGKYTEYRIFLLMKKQQYQKITDHVIIVLEKNIINGN